MKSFGHLWSGIVSPESLQAAMWRAAAGKKDRAPVARFLANEEDELKKLRDELLSAAYRPRPVIQFRIMDPKPRTITCADFRDRVVHHALCGAIGPILERRFVVESYACRKGKGVHRAVLRARRLAKHYPYYWKADIRSFYERVDHEKLLNLLRPHFREREVQKLIEIIVRHPIPGQLPSRGLPIGNLTSQWFANAYLDPFDHFLKETLRVKGYVRYMDDFVVFADGKADVFKAWAESEDYLHRELSLKLKPGASSVTPTSAGLPFLGMMIFPGLLRLKGSRKRRMMHLVRGRERACARGEIGERALQESAKSAVSVLRFFRLGGPWAAAL